jgi:hypothetical protein
MMSHSCRISGRVQGTSTSIRSWSVDEGWAERDMRVRRVEISCRGSESPQAALMYDEEAVVIRGAMGGERCEVPSGMWILTGSMEKGTAQYSENMVATMLMTMSSLVLSVAVVSMKMFLVLPATILESVETSARSVLP